METPINKQTISEIRDISSKFNLKVEVVMEDFIYVESTLYHHIVQQTNSFLKNKEQPSLTQNSFRIMSDYYSRNEYPLEKIAPKDTIITNYKNSLLQLN